MEHNAVGVLVAVGVALAWYAAGYGMGRRTVRPVPWSQCAACATRIRKAAFHQLFVEVWGADGVLRAKWPVGVAGGAQADRDSFLVTDPDALTLLADQVRERVVDIYRRQAI